LAASWLVDRVNVITTVRWQAFRAGGLSRDWLLCEAELLLEAQVHWLPQQEQPQVCPPGQTVAVGLDPQAVRSQHNCGTPASSMRAMANSARKWRLSKRIKQHYTQYKQDRQAKLPALLFR
jgi:hypothetical protein